MHGEGAPGPPPRAPPPSPSACLRRACARAAVREGPLSLLRAPKPTESVGFEPLWAPRRAMCMARGRQARPLALPLPASAHACGCRGGARPALSGSPFPAPAHACGCRGGARPAPSGSLSVQRMLMQIQASARRQSKNRQRSDARGALSQHGSQGPKAKQKPPTVRRTRSPQPARPPRRPEGKAKAAVRADIPNCETNVDRSARKQSKLPQVKAD